MNTAEIPSALGAALHSEFMDKQHTPAPKRPALPKDPDKLEALERVILSSTMRCREVGDPNGVLRLEFHMNKAQYLQCMAIDAEWTQAYLSYLKELDGLFGPRGENL